MGKFSDYVSSINEQTNILRKNLTNATGVDCSKKSIAGCADVVADYVPDLEEQKAYYNRPSWYPDIKSILNSAIEITKDGVTYFPAYIMLFNNLYTETAFYKLSNATSGAVNYYKSTGGDAVLCSDRCNNDISNANADALEVGTTTIHTWDTSKDISDPNEKDLNKVRWAIVYTKSKTLAIPNSISGWKDCLEIVTGNVTLGSQSMLGNGNSENSSILYIEIQPTTKWTDMSTDSLSKLKKLIILIVDSAGLKFSSNLDGCDSLKFLRLPAGDIHTTFASSLNALEVLHIPAGASYTYNSAQFLTKCYSLKTLIMPEGFNFIAGLSSAYNIRRVVVSGTNLTGSSSSTSFLGSAYVLEELIFDTNSTKLDLRYCAGSAFSLRYIKIPSSVKELLISAASLRYVTYIELFNDFDISALNFTGRVTKELQWLRDLCLWLKDRTGETANTIIIGPDNLANAERLWLTFNPDNKRDITWVDAGTEGAINIVDFITNQLNWTLS